MLLASCSNPESNFTLFEGFEEIRSLQSSALPTPSELALLERHQPDLYVAHGQEGPIDFYADYIAHGCLQAPPATVADCAIDQANLNAVKDSLVAIFTHNPNASAATPVAYGSVYRGTVELPGLEPSRRDWMFLRYHFVFRHSGISAGVTPWQGFLLGLVGDLDDWHQLDHYTSAVVVLDENDRPVAVLLQQHNYMHTYLIGADPAFPAAGPLAVDVALRSNEFYPHRPEPADHPAASFLSPKVIPWLTGEGKQPFTATLDKTSPDRKIAYELKFLAPNDAFYTFRGKLGEQRLLPGRDGPPGAIYYTLPALWHYEISLPMFYWNSPDPEFIEVMADMKSADPTNPLPQQRIRLVQALVANNLVN